ncbi:MAG: nucleotidyltransferase domain-containing protein [Oscillospiraceae bacterium]|nr:nucleotidyltransferase domain-containing protein [Oscillospiraceae bacterium]
MDRLNSITHITDEVSVQVQDTLGDKLCKVILYGSRARGDNNEESDIDIMVLADINDDQELHKMEKILWDIGWEVGFENDIMISVFLKNNTHFYEWMDAMAYYRNIIEDGVVLYGAKTGTFPIPFG